MPQNTSPTTGSPSTKWTIHHLTVFCLTFMGYAYFHATRKSFSNVKDTISEEWTPSFSNASIDSILPDKTWNTRHLFHDTKHASVFLGGLDSAFLLSYAVGLYISGFIGDRVNLRLVLTFGMCSSAISVFLFGTLSEYLNIYNEGYYMVFWILNGLLQSTGWPAMVAVMANWFGKSSRGFVLGLWSACASVGNIIGALVASGVLDFGYQYVFLVPASMLFGGGVIIFFGLVPHPHHVGLPGPDEDEDDAMLTVDREIEREPLLGHVEEEDQTDGGLLRDGPEVRVVRPKRAAMGFLQAVLLPGVIPYSLAYACLKLVNYAFFFWLPYYLTNQFKWEESVADQISIWYDVGGIIGGIVGGYISDRLRLRTTVVTVMLILAMPSLYIYSISPNDKTINSVLMGVTGFWIGGPANLISSAISADIGKDGSVRGNQEALATVTGIVDGTGSVGGALGQILIPLIENNYSWRFVFYLFILMTGLTAVCIIPMQVKEIRSMGWYQRRWGPSPVESPPPPYLPRDPTSRDPTPRDPMLPQDSSPEGDVFEQ